MIAIDHNKIKVAAEITAIFAAIFGVTSYFISLIYDYNTEREKRTLQYASEYRAGSVGVSRRTLLNTWIGRVDSQAYFALGANSAVRDKFVRDVVFTVDGLTMAVVDVTVFFDELSECVSNGLCAKPTVLNIFREDVESHFHLYLPIICDLRRKARLTDLGSAAAKLFEPEIRACA